MIQSSNNNIIFDNKSIFNNNPQHWEFRRLRHIGTLQNGVSEGAEYFGSGYPFVSYGDVYNNTVLPNILDSLAMSSNSDRKRFSVEEGDVFFTRTSEIAEEIGVSSVCLKTIKNAVFSGFLIRFRPDRKILIPDFSKYYFRSDIPRYFFVKEMNLVTRVSLSQNILKNFPILIPPIETQKQIADFLDCETGRIDRLIEKKKLLVNVLENHDSAIIETYVTKGIRNHLNMCNSGVDWIGLMPSHWEKIPLRALFRFRNEKNNPIKTEEILSLSIAHGVTKYTEKGRGGNKHKDDLTAYKLAHKGDIVLNSMNVIVGAVGRSEYFGAISPVYYALYPINESTFVPYFEKIFLNTGFQKGLLRFGKGILMKVSSVGKMNTIRMKVSQNDLKNIEFPFPPEEEQREISKFLDKKLNSSREARSLTLRSIERLIEFRTALITKSVTGQLDIKTWKKRGNTDKSLDNIEKAMRT